MPDLAAVIVTRNRAAKLARTIDVVRDQDKDADLELIVVDDGSEDETPAVIDQIARDADSRCPVTTFSIPPSGISAARNLAVEHASAPAVVFLNDDTVPRPGALARHSAFHRERRDERVAMIGLTVSAPETLDTDFMRWLELRSRVRWELPITSAGELPARHFHGANTSIGRELLLEEGGFDKRFAFGCEDFELGWRLEQAGVRMFHDPEAVFDHDHRVDLAEMTSRLRIDGSSLRLLCELHPDAPAPRRPGIRHRARAAALTAAMRTGVGGPRMREESWRFLCHESYREGYWGEPDPGPPHVRIGRRLGPLVSAKSDRNRGSTAAAQL